MGLFDRIKRVNANLNDLVSRAEDPENARTVYPGDAGRLGAVASELPRPLPLTNALSNSIINLKMKRISGNAQLALQRR